MSSGADAEARRNVERALERIEERLYAAPAGLHAVGRPASDAALTEAGLPEVAALVWRAFDGIELAGGEARLFALAELQAATNTAAAEGLLQPGDRVIGERGRETLVLPEDPWAEGGDVVVVGDDVERGPEASTVAHWILGVLGELAVLYDEDGEFRDGLFDDEDGELTAAARRRLLRRRLDLDEDAPRARLLLARLLREAGETRAAAAELTGVLRRAPDWCWAHHERGLLESKPRPFQKAADCTDDDVLKAHFLAHAAAVADDTHRPALAEKVLALRPDYVTHQREGAKAHLARNAPEDAAPLIRLGLAIAPRNLELLALKKQAR